MTDKRLVEVPALSEKERGDLQDIYWFLRGYVYKNGDEKIDFGNTHIETILRLMRDYK